MTDERRTADNIAYEQAGLSANSIIWFFNNLLYFYQAFDSLTPCQTHRQITLGTTNMTRILIIIFLLLGFKLIGQVPQNEKWRYVNMSTSMCSNKYLKTLDVSEDIVDNSCKNHKYLIVDTISKTDLKGRILNCSESSIYIEQCSYTPTEFYTEVRIKGKWKLFQIESPLRCCNDIGEIVLEPFHQCNFTLERLTNGSRKITIRIVLKTKKSKIYSTPINISCSDKQYKMILKKIRPYTC